LRPVGSAPGRHSLSKLFPKPFRYRKPSLKGSVEFVVVFVVPEGVDEAVAGLLDDIVARLTLFSFVRVATVNQSNEQTN
jgi:hypothetical protein